MIADAPPPLHEGHAGEEPVIVGEPERRVGLLHCILCHHGPDLVPGRRFGSPEALALYRLNSLEAGVKGVPQIWFTTEAPK